MIAFPDKPFGFGCMRLPVLEAEKPDSFNYKLIEEMFDEFLSRGFTYFDTAYVYHAFKGEAAVKKALVERYPRNAFQLATKLPLHDFKDAADMEKIFQAQLSNCGVDYFDFYLLHNMGQTVYDKCKKYHAFEFVKRKQEEGFIKYVGMSFHDTPELLDKVLAEYADDLDFLQLQINYADMEQSNVQARRCLEVANRYEKPVSVMEPCKGGTLVNLPEEAKQLLKAYSPERSEASWALRFAAQQPGVFMVLSGMNSMEQVRDNCSTFEQRELLSEEELDLLDKINEIRAKLVPIQCTGCEYCTHDCPQKIAIPQYFAAYNSQMQTTGGFSSQNIYFSNMNLSDRGTPSDCIKCGLCEENCPQHLPIRDWLETVDAKFEEIAFKPGE